MAKKRATGDSDAGRTAEAEGRDWDLLIEEARRAASNCIHAVCRFIVASGQPLSGAEYRQAIQDELDASDALQPYQVLVRPLLDAISEYDELIRPVRELLPNYDNYTESRELYPSSPNYHELAHAIACKLHRSMQRHDPDLLASVITRQPASGTEWLEELSSAPVVPSPYATMSSYQLAPFHWFVSENWRFCRLNYEVIRRCLWDESQGVFEAVDRRVSGHARVEVELIHAAGTEPPAKYRRDQIPDGDPIGPVSGTREALGFALHTKDGLSVQAYKQHFRSRARNQIVWARQGAGRQIEMFVTSYPVLHRCEERLVVHGQLKPPKPNETTGETR